MIKKSCQTSIPLEGHCLYNFDLSSPPETINLYLHGFGQTAEQFSKIIEPILTDKDLILNAPFPIPNIFEKKIDFASMRSDFRFTWYFYNKENDTYLIKMDSALEYIQTLLQSLNLLDHKFNIIGYSQGGYLAPFLGQALKNVSKVLSCHASLREDKLFSEKAQKLPFSFYQINANQDEFIDNELAKERFNLAKEKFSEAQFIEVNSKHRIKSETLEAISKILD
ncbi:MAG: hypothetical protein ACPGJV_07260 [Bacteriovoracaceae bacterium]